MTLDPLNSKRKSNRNTMNEASSKNLEMMQYPNRDKIIHFGRIVSRD